MIALVVSLSLGFTTRVSVASDGSQGNGGTNGDGVGSENGVINSGGRWIAFDSEADNLVPNDANGAKDIFLHDLHSRTTISLTRQGNLNSHHPAISANGRFVTFWSEATNLVSGDANDMPDVFVYDRASGATERDSFGPSGGYFPAISASGRFVAFTNGDVIVHDRVRGLDENLGEGTLPTISLDGRWVGYAVVNTQDFSQWKSYLYDRHTDTLEDMAPGANSRCDRPSVSDDGRYAVFNSYATNLVPGPELPPFIWRGYLRDRMLGTIELVSEYAAWDPVITPDGRYVAFDSSMPGPWDAGWNVFRLDRATGIVELLSPHANGGACFHPSMSASGQRVVYFSYSDSLIPGDTNGVGDVFLRRSSAGADTGDDEESGSNGVRLPEGTFEP